MLKLQERTALKSSPLSGQVRAFLDTTETTLSTLLKSPTDISQLTSSQIRQIRDELSTHKESITKQQGELQKALHLDTALSGTSGGQVIDQSTLEAIIKNTKQGDQTIQKLTSLQKQQDDNIASAQIDTNIWIEQSNKLGLYLQELQRYQEYLYTLQQIVDNTPAETTHQIDLTLEQSNLLDISNFFASNTTKSSRQIDSMGDNKPRNEGPIIVTATDHQGQSRTIKIQLSPDSTAPYSASIDRSSVTIIDTKSNTIISEDDYPLQFDMRWYQKTPIDTTALPSNLSKSVTLGKTIQFTLNTSTLNTTEKENIIIHTLSENRKSLQKSFEKKVLKNTFTNSLQRKESAKDIIQPMIDTLPKDIQGFWKFHEDLCRKTLCHHIIHTNPCMTDFISLLAEKTDKKGTKGYKDFITQYLSSLPNNYISDPLRQECINSKQRRSHALGSRYQSLDTIRSKPNDTTDTSTIRDRFNQFEQELKNTERIGSTDYTSIFQQILRGQDSTRASLIAGARDQSPLINECKGSDGKKRKQSLSINYNPKDHYTLSRIITDPQGISHDKSIVGLSSIDKIHQAIKEQTESIPDSDNAQGSIYAYSTKSVLDYLARATLNTLPKKKFKANDTNLGALYRKEKQAMVVGLLTPETTPKEYKHTEGLPSSDYLTALAKGIQYTQARKDRDLSSAIFDKKSNIGQGSLAKNPLLSARSRLDKQTPITIRPDLVLYPTQYGWTRLQGTGDNKKILRSDGKRVTFISDQQAESELRKHKIRLQQGNDTEDIRHNVMNLGNSANHALIEDNIQFGKAGIDVAGSIGKLAGGTLGLLSFNKSGLSKFTKSVSGFFKSVTNFIGANLRQFTGLVALGRDTVSTTLNTGKYIKNSITNTVALGQETIGKKYINPLLKESNSLDFLLHHIPSSDTQANISPSQLITQVCMQQINDKLSTQTNHVSSHMTGGDIVPGTNKSLLKRIRQRNKSKTSESTKRLDTYQRLRGGYFVRYGQDNQKVLCISRNSSGQMIMADVKVRNLTSTFDNKLGAETINHEGSYKHQEQLMHEYDSGPLSGDLLQSWIDSQLSVEESPIRGRCIVPEDTANPRSDTKLQDVCEDPAIWSKLMNVVDKGYGNRIAPLGNTTPEHPLPAYNKPLDYSYNPKPAPTIIPKPSYPKHKISNPTYNKPSSDRVSRDVYRSKTPERMDISIVIDQSGSMDGDKYDAQKNAVDEVMKSIYSKGIAGTESSKIFTNVYGGIGTLLFTERNQFTQTDSDELKNSIPNSAGSGGDGIDHTLQHILDEFLQKPTDYQQKVKDGEIVKAIYVTTDGQINPGPIDQLRNLGIYVYGIGIKVGKLDIENSFGSENVSTHGNGITESNINKLGEKVKSVIADSLIEFWTDNYEESTPSGGKKKFSITIDKAKKTEDLMEEEFDSSNNLIAIRKRKTKQNNIPQILQRGPLAPDPIHAEEKYLNPNTNQWHHIIKEYDPANPGTIIKESSKIGSIHSANDILDHKKEYNTNKEIIKESYNKKENNGDYESYNFDSVKKSYTTKIGNITTSHEIDKISGTQEQYKRSDSTNNREERYIHHKDMSGNLLYDHYEEKINNITVEDQEQKFDSQGNLVSKDRIVYKANTQEIQYKEIIDIDGNVDIIEPVNDVGGNAIGKRKVHGRYEAPGPIILSDYSIYDTVLGKEVFTGTLQENTTLSTPNKSVLESFSINDYDNATKLFPPIDQLMSAIGGSTTTKTTVQQLLTSGNIHALKVDKKGKIRTIGLDDSSTVQIPLQDVPFVDKVWIDTNKLPQILITRQGDIETIESGDLDNDGYLDISKLDEEVIDKLYYTQGTLQIS